MAYNTLSSDHTSLMASISRIEKQLKLKGYAEQSVKSNYLTLDSENHKTIEDNGLKTSFYPSLTLSKQFDGNGADNNPGYLKYSNDFEVRKAIEKELGPYVSTVKADFKSTLNSFREEVKEFHRSQFDLKSYQETLAANRVNTSRIENDTKLSFEKISKEYIELDLVVKDLRERYSEVNRKVVQVAEDIKSRSETNAMMTYLEQKVGELDQRVSGNEAYKANEERIMLQVKEEVTAIKKGYDMKIEQLVKEKGIFELDNASMIQEKIEKDNETRQLKQSVYALTERINQIESINEKNQSELQQLSSKHKDAAEEIQKQKEAISNLSLKGNSNKEQEPIQPIADNNEDMKLYVDSNISKMKTTLKCEIDEIHAMVAQTNNDLLRHKSNNAINSFPPQPTEISISPELNDKVSNLAEQATTLQTQISAMKSDQLRLTSKLEDINKVATSNHNIVSVHNETQFSKLREEIEQLTAFFNQYKEEQIKLNEMYEMTLKTLATQLFAMQGDTKVLKQDQVGYEENMETIQDNFEKLKPIMDSYPKLKNEFGLITQIIQALTQNFEEIKKEVNNNFSSLSQWQTDLVANVTSAVNELKQDYNEKFRQSNAVISSGRFGEMSNSVKEDNSKANELSKKIDTLQLMSDRKYVAKNELEHLRSQIGEIEKKIKDSETKKDITVFLQPQSINKDNPQSSLTQGKSANQETVKPNEGNNFFDKDEDWDFQ